MQECFTCEEDATERYTMVLDSDTVLDDVVMCKDCHDSYAEVSWIEITDAPGFPTDNARRRVSEATY